MTSMVDASDDLIADPLDLINQIFSKLSIKKCVLVDDLAIKPVDANSVYELVIKNRSTISELSKIFPDIDFNGDEEIWLSHLVALFQKADLESLTNINKAIAKIEGASREAQDILDLHTLLPNSVSVEIISPEEWHTRRETLLSEATSTSRTLFLFDQELNVDGKGFGFVNGAEIIKDLSGSKPGEFGEKWFCGMLTHNVTQGAEVEHWRTLAKEHQIDLKYFMPISKQNLADKANFFKSVYRTIINIYCETIKSSASEGFVKALHEAIERFQNMDPIDFEHIVVKTSEKEGVSELETMIRIYGILHRDGVKEVLIKEPGFKSFSNAVTAVKSIADTYRALPTEVHARLLKLRHEELYEAGTLINSHHDPLRNGDIFQVGDNPTNIFVLIAPPCDLMVRSNGKRSREDNFKIAVIAPVDIVPLADKAPHERPGQTFTLPHILKSGEHAGIVKFSQATTANLPIFDLVVLNKEGESKIDPAAISSANYIFPTRSWEARAKKVLAKYFNKIATSIEDARKSHNDEIAELLSEAMIPRPAQSDSLRKFGTYSNKSFAYQIKRIGWVRDPLAGMLLAAFSRFLARDAHDVDYSDVQQPAHHH